MAVRDVMTPDPVTIGPEASVATVREVMRQRHIHHLPLVEDGRFAGVVDATQAFGWVPHDATAGDLAGRIAVQASADESLFEVLGRCAWSPRDVCVVTRPDSGEVVGIVTERDLVRLAAEHVGPARPVDEIASTTLVTVVATATVGECLERLRERMFRHLVVVEADGGLRGTVSLRDLLLVDARRGVGTTLPDEIVMATWGQPIRAVAREMRRLDVDAMPIAAPGSATAEGLVTVTDLLRALRSTPSIVA